MKRVDLGPKPDLKVAQHVTVNEQGIAPWTGTVMAVKPSSQSGWWVEIRRDGGGTYAMPAAVVS